MKTINYKKLGFSLSGGGAKGCFQAGALYYLLTTHILNYHKNIYSVAGTSVGSLNGAKIAEFGAGKTYVDDLKNIWYSIKKPSDIIKKNFFGVIGIAFGADSYGNSEPLFKLVESNINFSSLAMSKTKFKCSAYNTRTKEVRYFGNNDPFLKEAILASCSIPGAFNPIKIYNDYWLDGGVRDISPIAPLIDDECDLIIAIRCTQSKENPSIQQTHGINLINSVISSLVNEIYNNDLDKFLFINQFINDYRFAAEHMKVQGYYESEAMKITFEKLERQLSAYRYIDLIVIEPEYQKLDVDTLHFNNDQIKNGFKLGMETTKKIFEKYQIMKG